MNCGLAGVEYEVALSLTIRPGQEQERRRHVRQAVIDRTLAPVSIGPGQTSGLLLDISAAGAGIQALAPVKRGPEHRLRWKSPVDDCWIDIAGRIVWSRADDQLGIRFLDVPYDVQLRIEQIVNRLPANATFKNPPSTDLKQQTKPIILPTDGSLAAFLQEAKAITNADGIAVALRSNGHFVCRAKVGLAPEVGVAVSMEKGLSAECIRTGQFVSSADIQDDPRIKADYIIDSMVRAVIVVPLKRAHELFGVVTYIWSQPLSGGDNDIVETGALAQDVVASLYPAH